MRLKFDIPESYHPEAKKVMAEIIRQLTKKNTFEKQDFPALSLLLYSYHTYYVSRDILLTEGIMLHESETNLQQSLPGMEPPVISKMRAARPHPALKICNDSQNQITKILIEFGLTPKSRKKNLDVDNPPISPEPSPIDKFVKETIETR